MIKSDIMEYNYEIRHVKGESNCIADCLSRQPAWLISKDKKSDCDQDPIWVGSQGPRDELCLRVITEAKHLLRANPALAAVKKMGQKDPDYKMMIEYIRAKCNFWGHPSSYEGFHMGSGPILNYIQNFKLSSSGKLTVSVRFTPLNSTGPSYLRNCKNLGGNWTLFSWGRGYIIHGCQYAKM